MASQVSIYGPKLTTKSYVLEMKGQDFFDPVYRLPGVSLGTPEPETEDAVMIETFTEEGGYIQQRGFYARKAFEKSWSLEIGLVPGHGTYWNPIQAVANSRGTCRRTFYANYLCPEDPRYSHFMSYDDGILDTIRRTNNVISTTDAEEAVAATTTLRIEREKMYYALAISKQQTHASADPLYDVSFRLRHCQACPLDQHDYGVFGGGDGTAVPVIEETDDQFATSSAVTNSLAAGLIQTCSYTDGDLVIRGFADENVDAGATATAGAVLISTDGGTTVSALSGVTTPIYFIEEADGYYWMGGKDAVVYRLHQDLATVDTVTNPLASAGIIYADAAYDKDTNYLYIVGYNGANSVAHRVEKTAFSNITSLVNAGANKLYRVEVLGKDHVIVVGASGTIRESANASDNGTFNTVYSGTTDPIRGVCGDLNRCVIFAGTGVFERSRLTNDIFKEQQPVAGTTITGNFQDAAVGELYDGANYFVAVTDASEVVICKPGLPNA